LPHYTISEDVLVGGEIFFIDFPCKKNQFLPNPGVNLTPNKKPTLRNLSKWLVFNVGPVGIRAES